jgi:hypothetical protein
VSSDVVYGLCKCNGIGYHMNQWDCEGWNRGRWKKL